MCGCMRLWSKRFCQCQRLDRLREGETRTSQTCATGTGRSTAATGCGYNGAVVVAGLFVQVISSSIFHDASTCTARGSAVLSVYPCRSF